MISVELPAGASGDKRTLVFTNCWGISATTAHPTRQALAEYLTAAPQQLEFAKAFGVNPSIQSAEADYLEEFPENQPFVDGLKYARRGCFGTRDHLCAHVLNDFNASWRACPAATR